jgi:hypothetical protein
MSPLRLTIVSAALLLSTPAFASECYALATPVAAGDYIGRSDVHAVACREQASAAPLAYDRATRALRADAALAAGDYLGPLVIEAGRVARPGEELVLVVREGPVMIEREVSPVSPVRSGEEGFVRAEDGTVFAVTFIPGEDAQ